MLSRSDSASNNDEILPIEMTSAMATRPRILSRPATFRFLVLEKVSATGKTLLRIVATKEVRRRHNKMGVAFKVVQPPRCD